MIEKSTFLKLAETTRDIINQADNKEELELTGKLVDVVAELNYNNELHPDLGIELEEYVKLKMGSIDGTLEVRSGDPVAEQKQYLEDMLNSLR